MKCSLGDVTFVQARTNELCIPAKLKFPSTTPQHYVWTLIA